MTTLIWDVSTAYDLFVSIDVLHAPAKYGLRGAWAAGVRSRLNPEQREVLQTSSTMMMLWPTMWLSQLEGYKDASFVLQALEAVEPANRIELLSPMCQEEPFRSVFQRVRENGAWNETDKNTILQKYRANKRKGKGKGQSEKDTIALLDIWADSAQFGEQYLDALQTYYKVFYKEEEVRILPALEEAKLRAEEMTKEMSLRELLEDLSQGLRFPDVSEVADKLLMIPSFWVTPLTALISNKDNTDYDIFMFGGRPANMSIVPGDVVPDALFQALKALADPTRLRIMRYLSSEPMTPAELARRLRLRAPTVIHHLHALRLARLVHLTFNEDGRRYEARREAVTAAFSLLEGFLDQDKEKRAEAREELRQMEPA